MTVLLGGQSQLEVAVRGLFLACFAVTEFFFWVVLLDRSIPLPDRSRFLDPALGEVGVARIASEE